MLAGVPQAVADLGAGGDPVSGHQGGIQAQKGRPGLLRSRDDLGQIAGMRGDRIQRLTRIFHERDHLCCRRGSDPAWA